MTTVLQLASTEGRIFLGANEEMMRLDHTAVLEAIEQRDVRNAVHSMALHVDRDLGLQTDMLDFGGETERMVSLKDAGFDPSNPAST